MAGIWVDPPLAGLGAAPCPSLDQIAPGEAHGVFASLSPSGTLPCCDVSRLWLPSAVLLRLLPGIVRLSYSSAAASALVQVSAPPVPALLLSLFARATSPTSRALLFPRGCTAPVATTSTSLTSDSESLARSTTSAAAALCPARRGPADCWIWSARVRPPPPPGARTCRVPPPLGARTCRGALRTADRKGEDDDDEDEDEDEDDELGRDRRKAACS